VPLDVGRLVRQDDELFARRVAPAEVEGVHDPRAAAGRSPLGRPALAGGAAELHLPPDQIGRG
jgi:hypothetical protein